MTDQLWYLPQCVPPGARVGRSLYLRPFHSPEAAAARIADHLEACARSGAPCRNAHTVCTLSTSAKDGRRHV